MAFTLAQLQALAIVPKFTGLLSMVGSSVIILDVLRDRKKQTQTYSRIMASMSSFDFVTSLMYALSTWPIPKGSGPLYAVGTVQSCTFQGFFIQLSLAAPLYNFSLAVYYLLVIKYSWSDIRLARVEKFVHPTIATVAIGIAIVGLPLKIFNNANVWCWIAPSDRMSNIDDANQIYRWAFYYAELWTSIIAITAIMFLVVVAVVRTERKTASYSANQKARLSNTVKKQALYYVSAFYITWTFPTTLRILQTTGTPVPYAIFLCAVIFTPMQGFFNCLIYLRPRYLRRRQARWGRQRALERDRPIRRRISRFRGASSLFSSGPPDHSPPPAISSCPGERSSALGNDGNADGTAENEGGDADTKVALAEANRKGEDEEYTGENVDAEVALAEANRDGEGKEEDEMEMPMLE